MKRRRTLKLPISYDLALSERGDRIAALGRRVVTGDTVSLKRLASCHPLSDPCSSCFNGDGSLLAVKNTSGRIVVIDPMTGETVTDLKNDQDGEGSNILFSVDGDFLVDGSWDGQIQVRHARTGRIECQLGFDGEMITEVSRSTDGQQWAFLHQPKTRDGEEFAPAPYVSLWRWPFTSLSLVHLKVDDADAAVLSPCGHLLAVAGYSRVTQETRLQVLEASGKVIQEVTIDRSKGLRWSPCATLLGRIGDSEIALHSATDLAQRKSYALEYPSSVCFAPNLSFIALGSWDEGIVQPLEL